MTVLSEKNATIEIKESMTVADIAALHSRICQYAASTESLTVVIESGAELDMTFFQLVCTAHRYMTANGREFNVCGDHDLFFERSEALGFTRHKGCIHDRNKSCIRVKKED
jgi:hypothetical protein